MYMTFHWFLWIKYEGGLNILLLFNNIYFIITEFIIFQETSRKWRTLAPNTIYFPWYYHRSSQKWRLCVWATHQTIALWVKKKPLTPWGKNVLKSFYMDQIEQTYIEIYFYGICLFLLNFGIFYSWTGRGKRWNNKILLLEIALLFFRRAATINAALYELFYIKFIYHIQ